MNNHLDMLEQAMGSVVDAMHMETDIIRKIVSDALEYGCSVTHNNGEEDTVTVYAKTRGDYESAVDAVMKQINQTDLEYLIFKLGESKIGWVQLVYGNTGYDVVCDYTASDEMEKILAGATALAEKLESEFYK